ncbi:MAG: hypothetical protein V4676_08935, partial [Bacteroidota bacterium]
TILVTTTLLLISCSPTINADKKGVYNEQLNQQYWTANFSPDDKLIAVAGVDSLLRIYHSKNLKLYQNYAINSWIHCVKWNPDGNSLAIATLDNYVLLLNMQNGQLTQLKSTGGSRAIGWNHNGEILAVADLDGAIILWNKNGTLLRNMENKNGPEVAGSAYLALDWHPTKNIFVATNFKISVFDPSGHELKTMQHTNPAAIMLCVKWHPSGSYFVIGDYGHNWNNENVPTLLHFWSSDGILIKSVAGSRAEIRNMAWNKNGTLLATASDVLRVWNNNGELLHQSAPDGTNNLWGIDWSKKGDKIVTASRYKTVALWDSTAKLLKKIEGLRSGK